MDVERLRETLANFDSAVHDKVGGLAIDVRVLIEVARLVVEAPEKRWCVTHDAESIENHGGSSDECWRVVWAESDSPEGLPLVGYRLCRMEARLLVPPKVAS